MTATFVLTVLIVAGTGIGIAIGYRLREARAKNSLNTAEAKANELVQAAENKQNEVLQKAKEKAIKILE